MPDDLFLAIETSSPCGSVALGDAGGVIGARVLVAERRHTGELLPAIRDLLRHAGRTPRDVTVLCFSQGPGSFTGLRVAATIARMWQSAVGCRVVGVPSLAVIAANAWGQPRPPARVAVILDARQGRIFGAVYERDAGGAVRECGATGLYEAARWLPQVPRPCAVLGDGVAVWRQNLAEIGLDPLPEETWGPDARRVLAIGRAMATAGRFLPPEEIVPAYHRRPECEEVYEQRRAAARERRGE